MFYKTRLDCNSRIFYSLITQENRLHRFSALRPVGGVSPKKQHKVQRTTRDNLTTATRYSLKLLWVQSLKGLTVRNYRTSSQLGSEILKSTSPRTRVDVLRNPSHKNVLLKVDKGLLRKRQLTRQKRQRESPFKKKGSYTIDAEEET